MDEEEARAEFAGAERELLAYLHDELLEELDQRADIDGYGGPNWAMRQQAALEKLLRLYDEARRRVVR